MSMTIRPEQLHGSARIAAPAFARRFSAQPAFGAAQSIDTFQRSSQPAAPRFGIGKKDARKPTAENGQPKSSGAAEPAEATDNGTEVSGNQATCKSNDKTEAAAPTAKADGTEETDTGSASIDFDELVDTLCAQEGDSLKQALHEQFPEYRDNKVHILKDSKGRGTLTLMKQDNKGTPLLWFDLDETGDELLEKISDQYSFQTFEESQENNEQVFYERPSIDKDSAQLTAYTLNLVNNGDDVEEIPVHLYAGKNFVVSHRDVPSKTLDEQRELFVQTGPDLTPAKLLGALVDELVHSNRNIIESLYKNNEKLSGKLKEEIDKNEFIKGTDEEFLKTITKTQDIDETLMRQAHVLDKLQRLNKWHRSTLVENKLIGEALGEVRSQINAVDKFRESNTHFTELHAAVTANILNWPMLKMTQLFTASLPLTVATGIYGMNVGLPVQHSPAAFAIVMGSSAIASTGLFAWMKKKKLFGRKKP